VEIEFPGREVGPQENNKRREVGPRNKDRISRKRRPQLK
jgi:hypothetical protein